VNTAEQIDMKNQLVVKTLQVECLEKEIDRLKSLVNDFEAANIRRQGEIENLIAQAKSRVDNLEQLKKDNARLTRQLSELQKEKTKKASITDYSLVPEEMLAELGLAYLQDEGGHYGDDTGEDLQAIVEKCQEAATFTPHPQQPTYIDDKGVRRFRKNKLIESLVDEAGGRNDMRGINYVFSLPASREDQAQLAQLIGYSVDGYQRLSYALPLEDEE
jgi:vacuolar-type H+-ATPase subunit I/STV1